MKTKQNKTPAEEDGETLTLSQDSACCGSGTSTKPALNHRATPALERHTQAGASLPLKPGGWSPSNQHLVVVTGLALPHTRTVADPTGDTSPAPTARLAVSSEECLPQGMGTRGSALGVPGLAAVDNLNVSPEDLKPVLVSRSEVGKWALCPHSVHICGCARSPTVTTLLLPISYWPTSGDSHSLLASVPKSPALTVILCKPSMASLGPGAHGPRVAAAHSSTWSSLASTRKQLRQRRQQQEGTQVVPFSSVSERRDQLSASEGQSWNSDRGSDGSSLQTLAPQMPGD